MPTTPYADLYISVNGGAAQKGGITVDPDDSVQLVPGSTVGWATLRTAYQITDYPPGWTAPAGWVLDTATGHYEYYANGANGVQPPAIPMPDGAAVAAGQWGKWMFRLLVNGGGGALTDTTCGVRIVSTALNLNGIARGESTQFDTQRAWVGELDHDLRAIEAGLGVYGFVTSVTGNPPIVVTAGSTPTVSLTASASAVAGVPLRDANADLFARDFRGAGLVVGARGASFSSYVADVPQALGGVTGTVVISGTTGSGNVRCQANGAVTFGVPTGFVDGSRLRIAVTQGGGGPYAVSWNAAFAFPTDQAAGAAIGSTRLAAVGHIDIWEFILEIDQWICRGHWYT